MCGGPRDSEKTACSRCLIRKSAHYGGKCICCVESNWAFLEFDHITMTAMLIENKSARLLPIGLYRTIIPIICNYYVLTIIKLKGFMANTRINHKYGKGQLFFKLALG
jgi:hypothetical protein